MPRHVTPCTGKQWGVMGDNTMAHHVIPRHTTPHHATPHHTTSHHITPSGKQWGRHVGQHDDDGELPTAPRDTMRYEIETLPTELGAAHVRERCSLYLGRPASDM